MTAAEVAAWLNTRDRTSAKPATVTIGRTTYVGAHYTQVRDVDPGCRAYDDGKRTYTIEALYLLGQLPSSYVHRHAGAYLDGSGRRHYVAGWYAENPPNEYHPFGTMFMLFPDDYNVTSEARVMPMAVQS